MNLFIAVVFACVSGECNFSSVEKPFYSMEDCQSVMRKSVDLLAEQNIPAYGTCVVIKINHT